ncbi:hypothetical protein Mp_8g01280 [Marchantia polymorpha subsp. ruderalis]|uniref:Uncharacterized protein n=1 Tax=Marchantia polymorpha TaxID=3197 RepID=A0A2R6WRA3_MARPO|nr:hypothetical protein MARPO_0064s0070 [Marchantia polymorpha]BBN18283.1 hypothetical protein Mp_8g01280 [Marchantia polymorpha subsp. ruderalis]|eukprot:PTQ36389.1 hypothetical protein MARPO_0064s0070 [Marchantia polymorpha]
MESGRPCLSHLSAPVVCTGRTGQHYSTSIGTALVHELVNCRRLIRASRETHHVCRRALRCCGASASGPWTSSRLSLCRAPGRGSKRTTLNQKPQNDFDSLARGLSEVNV